MGSSSCVLCTLSFSELSIFDCPFDILQRVLDIYMYISSGKSKHRQYNDKSNNLQNTKTQISEDWATTFTEGQPSPAPHVLPKLDIYVFITQSTK